MAKIVLPLNSYKENTLHKIASVFPEQNLFVAGVDCYDGNTIESGLRERISSIFHKREISDQDKLHEKFKEDSLRLKISFDIYNYPSHEYNVSFSELSKYADLIYYGEGLSFTTEVCNKISATDLSSPFLIAHEDILKTQRVIVPLIGDSCIQSLKRFASLFQPFLINKNVIVLTAGPKCESEINNEKYLVEYLRTNFPSVSLIWFQSSNYVEELQEYISLNEPPALLIVCKKSMNVFKECLINGRVSIFAGN